MKPTKQDLLNAAGKTVPDVIALDLRLLIVGINPGLYSAAIGHHFGRPGNRFWPAIHRAGLTPRLLTPYEERELLEVGIGITNFVARATATAAELSKAELLEGGRTLEEKVLRWRPLKVAVLGVTAYRAAFERPKAVLGMQTERLGGAELWVLPNPSGLNAHFDLDALASWYRQALGNAL